MSGPGNLRFVSIGTKLAALTAALLSVVGLVLYVELVDREWQSLVDAKRRAAAMVADLFAASLVVPLDFGDVQTIQKNLVNLEQNGDVLNVVVRAEGRAAPLIDLHPEQALPTGPDADPESISALGDRVVARRIILDPTGRRLGTSVVHFSLAPERSALQSAKRRLLEWALALTVAVAAVMIGLTRRLIVGPLMSLADATREMEAGRAVHVEVRTNDEVGRLGAAFNTMAIAIADRERLRADRTRAEQALARNERLSRRTLEESSDLIALIAADGTLLQCSSSSTRLIGFAPDELEATDMTLLFHPDDRASFAERLVQLAAQPGAPLKDERRVQRKDGTFAWFEFTSTNLLDDPDLRAIVTNGHEITARMEAAEALRELNEHLERRVAARTNDLADLYNRAPCGYFTIAPGSYFHRVNDTLLDWLGYTREEVVGKKQLADVTAPQSLATAHEWFDALESCEGTVGDLELVLVRKDGRPLSTSLYATVLMHGDGEPSELLVTVVDITERKRVETRLLQSHEELRATHAALARASRAKDGFLAAMSHELRTPLNAVLGLSESLQEGVYGELSEKQRSVLARMDDSGQHLLALISDILDLSKIEAGMRPLHLVTVSLEEVCRASLAMVQELAQKKRLTVSLEVPAGLPPIQADERSLTQILLNLLGNAVKFTAEGGSIGLEVTPQEGGDQLCVTVWDTGIGISWEDQMRLFQPFVQLDDSLSRRHAGTGLGLALVYRLAVLNGGGVSVTSEPGAGSRFSVVLPTGALSGAPQDDPSRSALGRSAG